ncbi:MAG: hypothetical protein JRE23_00290 [Deltaproteobacteria bacterium]|nr:hypothetical protein [Deltaproteobacteria bacterium]
MGIITKLESGGLPSNLGTRPQIMTVNPQGPMTQVFNDYVFRKSSGEFYESLREGIPIIDAAIRRLISLNGTIKIIGDNAAIVKELEDFCLAVPVNDTQKGIHAFLENFSNETFEQGFSISEFVATKDLKDISGLRVADSKQIIYRRNKAGKAEPWYRYSNVGMYGPVYKDPAQLVDKILNAPYGYMVPYDGWNEVKLNPSNVFYNSINNENSDPYGVSIMRSMEFVSQILMTIQNSIKSNYERYGDPSYHMHYTSSKGGDDTKYQAQRVAMEEAFVTVIDAKRRGRSGDFTTAGSKDSTVDIKVIGADNQVLESEIPLRHVLEQIVAKTNLPSWMLGLYWSTTERMATLEIEAALQDAKIRQLAMYPEFIRLFSTYLSMRGHKWKTITTSIDKPGDWGFVFETPNLRDMVAKAQARFLNAQADMYDSQYGPGAEGAQGSYSGKSYRGHQARIILKESAKGSTSSHGACGCPKKHTQDGLLNRCKENTRRIPYPELDEVEREYEADLVEETDKLQDRIFDILKLTDTVVKSIGRGSYPAKVSRGKQEEPPAIEPFTFTEEQRAAVYAAIAVFTQSWNPATDPDEILDWHYGRSYSLGLLRAAESLGTDQPVLNIINNSKIYEGLVKDGFTLVKKGTTREITTKVIAEMEAQMLAGTNSRHVADVLSKVFDNANDNWERLARSEMAMAAETAKIDEFKAEGVDKMHYYAAFDACPICLPLEGDYDINDVPLPVRDTHPRCYCTLGPVVTEG